MFWSKIWFFLGAVAAAAALTVALILPRPAGRAQLADERQRLTTACSVFRILMVNNAKDRVALAGTSARAPRIVNALSGVNPNRPISPDDNRVGRSELNRLLGEISGTPPDFAVLLDARGRVVARKGIDERDYGDTLAGYYVVDDALAGYLRDDLWMIEDKLFAVAASPVIKRTPDRWVGAVVLGREVDKEWVEQFVRQLQVEASFYADGRVIASSSSEAIHDDVVAARAAMTDAAENLAEDCTNNDPIAVTAGDTTYLALIARLPGEAGERDAFYAVYTEQPRAIDMMGMLGAATKSDVAFGNFPWIAVGAGFVLFVAVGIGLMVFEADRPLRKLGDDAVKLAKGDARRLDEDAHRAKFGSIARSVNIHLDKIARESRPGKPDINEMLGPEVAPSVLPGAPALGFSPPPPSEFRFPDPSPPRTPAAPPPLALDLPAAAIPAVPAAAPPRAAIPTPPPLGAATPPRKPPPLSLDPGQKTPPPLPRTAPAEPPPPPPPSPSLESPSPSLPSIDDDILGGEAPPPGDESSFADLFTADGMPAGLRAPSDVANEVELEEEFRRVFDEFVAVKQQCGEPTASLTFDKFVKKLRKNREALMAKHSCKRVRFQVYVKEGKAALKATPVGKADG